MPVVVYKLNIIFPLQFSKKFIENLFRLFLTPCVCTTCKQHLYHCPISNTFVYIAQSGQIASSCLSVCLSACINAVPR